MLTGSPHALPIRRESSNRTSKSAKSIGRVAFDIDHFQWRDAFGVGDHRRQRNGGLLERLLLRRAYAANAHIGLVWKMLPICSSHNVHWPQMLCRDIR